jgi:hypothetical protein
MPKFRKRPVVIEAVQLTETTEIKTLEGTMTGNPGDWLITGVKGEQYPCKPDIFAATYEPAASGPMSFGQALEALRTGKHVARAGWNGKGMWLTQQKGYPSGIPINHNTAEATGVPEGTVMKFAPYLMMKSVSGEFFPWNPNQLDLLADDWLQVE